MAEAKKRWRGLNRRQRAVLWVGGAVAVVMCLAPPCRESGLWHGDYTLLFIVRKIDWGRLALQFIILALATVAALRLCRKQEARPAADSAPPDSP
ncbi:hypothetical protein LCGC14_2092360 [marine sediment metagenome]|uniref:Uncharacterized protein n=1 Tax=marine sediment metagenome TaxID=412755 RepID=A0A0F9EC91_9ZZZZ